MASPDLEELFFFLVEHAKGSEHEASLKTSTSWDD